MFEIKSQEVIDKNTGVHLAFGHYDADSKTVWVRVTNGDKISTLFFDRNGEVRKIEPHKAKPVEAPAPSLVDKIGPDPELPRASDNSVAPRWPADPPKFVPPYIEKRADDARDRDWEKTAPDVNYVDGEKRV